MQLFRSEAFDTFGKILPRAAEIAGNIFWIYLTLTLACMIAYNWAGLDFFDALVHAMTTIATGGFANQDSSFTDLGAAVEYVAVAFMILASLPFVRYVQLVAGTAKPLYRDSQIRAFLIVCLAVAGTLVLWQILALGETTELAIRKSLFNSISILTGTGFASSDYGQWGSFAVAVFFLIGLIGGCAGSTSCSIKIFRFQLLLSAIKSRLARIHSPSGIFQVRYDGRTVSDDVLSSVMTFFGFFILTLAVLSITLGFLGLDMITAVSGAATALANIGPGLGDTIGPAGNFASLSDATKWVLAFAMLIGRLELMSVYVLFTLAFWRQ
jgi:trk system potassium uptake protein TrkH